ncbi:hypothetical protein [Microbacterium tumbae]
MYTEAVINDLSALFQPIGIAGLAVAVICGVLGLVAVLRDAGGMLAAAGGGWFTGVLLSLAFLFSESWLPVLAAVAVLPVLVGLGFLVRGVVVRVDLALRALQGRPAPLSPAAKAAPWASAEGVLSAAS